MCRSTCRRRVAISVRWTPARDDRHGDRLRPGADPGRRTDHRARRDHPGADRICCAPSSRRAEQSDHPATHDLGIAASLCRRVSVMYAGQIRRDGAGRHPIFGSPLMPYTWGLIDSIRASTSSRAAPLPDAHACVPPDPMIGRCRAARFAARCQLCAGTCRGRGVPPSRERGPARAPACLLPVPRTTDRAATRPHDAAVPRTASLRRSVLLKVEDRRGGFPRGTRPSRAVRRRRVSPIARGETPRPGRANPAAARSTLGARRAAARRPVARARCCSTAQDLAASAGRCAAHACAGACS